MSTVFAMAILVCSHRAHLTRLASNYLCSQSWPYTLDPPASWMLELQACPPRFYRPGFESETASRQVMASRTLSQRVALLFLICIICISCFCYLKEFIYPNGICLEKVFGRLRAA